MITLARARREPHLPARPRTGSGRSATGEFCGWSQIVDPYGTRLAEAGETEEALLVAEIDVEKARDKDYVDPRRVRAATSSATAGPSSTARWSRSPEPVDALRRSERWPRSTSSSRRRSSSRTALKVSKSPWGPDDEIGRLNWITPDTNRAILEHLDGAHLFDLNVEYFIGMPSWVAAGDPPYGIWMTHTPQGSINDNLSGVGPHVHERYSYCGDSIHLYTHCGTHVDTLNHLGHHGMFWNGWTADKDLGSRIWNKGGLDKYPPIIARGVLLDVAGHARRRLPARRLRDHAEGPPGLRRQAGRRAPQKDVVLVRTGRMTVWPDFDGYLLKPPGISLPVGEVAVRGGGRDVHRRRLDRRSR